MRYHVVGCVYMCVYIYMCIYIYTLRIPHPTHARRKRMRHSSSGPRASACVEYQNICVVSCGEIYMCT